MTEGPRYSKPLGGAWVEYTPLTEQSRVDTPFELVVTMGDMEMGDAFSVPLPGIGPQTTVGELLDEVFPASREHESHVRTRLDLKANPDLPEMYDALLDAFAAWRDSRCRLEVYLNHGPRLSLSDSVSAHLRLPVDESGNSPATAVLDLVIEQRFTPLEHAVHRGSATAEELLEWLQERTLLYFIDAHGYELRSAPEAAPNRRLLPIAKRLVGGELVRQSGEPSTYTVTDRGGQVLADMAAEADSYADRYEQFADVVYDAESGAVKFETGTGADLRVAVYEAEGLDPLRAVFVQVLAEDALEASLRDWREAIHEQAFFDEMLAPVADRDTVEEPALDRIVEAGLSRLDERREESERRQRFSEVSRRRGISPSSHRKTQSKL